MTKRTPGPDGAAATPSGGVGAATARELVVDDAAAEKSAAEAALRELWQEFKKTGEPALRERLILHYSPLVKYVAGRVGVGPAAEHRAGRPRLVRHLRADRRDREVRPRARHQVRDLRDQPHPRRDHRRAARDRLDPALGPLQGPRGREGLRRARGPAAPHAHRGRGRRRDGHQARGPAPIFSQVSFVNVVALDELLSVGGEKGDKLSLVDTLEDTKAEDPVLAFESEETKYLLAKAINTLPEREKIVVTLYYYEGLTLAEIGQVLGVTESRICQMHTKAVLQLRGKLAEG